MDPTDEQIAAKVAESGNALTKEQARLVLVAQAAHDDENTFVEEEVTDDKGVKTKKKVAKKKAAK